MINMDGLINILEGILVFVGIIAVVFICFYLYFNAKRNDPVNNYPLDKVSVIKMQTDNCSPKEKQRRMVAGYYDKDANHPY